MRRIPSAYSTLPAGPLARMVAEEYGLPEPAVTLIRRAFNDNYRVAAGGERFILRVYLHDKYYVSGADDLRFELDLLDHLAADGVPVSTAIPGQDGFKLGSLRAPEGVRHYALFRYAPGSPVSAPTQAQTRALGELLARVHLSADRFRSRFPRHSLDLHALVDAPLARLAPYLKSRPDDWQFLSDTAARIRRHLAELELPEQGWGIIHGDPHAGNCHFENGLPTLFDFDTCGYGWRAYDVAIFMGNRSYEHRSDFLDSYKSVRPLSAPEQEALPVFIMARYLWDTGDILTMASIWGEAPMNRLADGLLADMRRLSEEYPQV